MRTSDASPSKHGMRRGHACDISRKRHALVSRVAVANVLKRWIEGSLVLGSVSSPYFECERLIESGTGGASASSGSVLATSSRRSKTVSLPAQPATIISVVQLNFVRVS